MEHPYGAIFNNELRPPVAGIQGLFWSEVTRQQGLLEFTLYSIVMALAERAWHGVEWEVVIKSATVCGKDYALVSASVTKQLNVNWQGFVYALSNKVLSQLASKQLNLSCRRLGKKLKTACL